MPILVRRRRRIVFKPKDSRQCKHDHAHSKSPWISPHQDPRKSKTGSKSSIQDWTMSQESRSDEIRERKDDHHKSLVDNTPHGSFTGGDDDSVLGHDELNVAIPSLFTSVPLIRDSLETKSTVLQDDMVRGCLPLLGGVGDPSRSLFTFNAHGLPRLERAQHVQFLHCSLQGLSAGYVSYDASRPWIVYWVLVGLCLLGEDVGQYRERVVQTLSPMQNLDGGFGGGHGQTSHCAPSYAAVLSLAMVGPTESLDLIDRRALWRWLGELKQEDGGFAVCVGGERDVRGAYCTMVMVSLLALPHELPPGSPARAYGHQFFSSALPEYLSRCQTFEGGISGAPQTEAHGSYAFCVLACLCILGPPQEMIPKYLDISSLISWLSARQYAPEGGLSGRTNKLVDGCYSHWVGGSWPLIEAALNHSQSHEFSQESKVRRGLFSRKGLIRYILSCCQSKGGGLRDKPYTRADAYHTCYTLAGLSSTQHYNYYTGPQGDEAASPLGSALHWASSPQKSSQVDGSQNNIFDEEDRLTAIHPIYVIPWGDVEQTHAWFREKEGF